MFAAKTLRKLILWLWKMQNVGEIKDGQRLPKKYHETSFFTRIQNG
jgi:hypothetical protein